MQNGLVIFHRASLWCNSETRLHIFWKICNTFFLGLFLARLYLCFGLVIICSLNSCTILSIKIILIILPCGS
ncbi:hypothetical protein C2G38_74387 [Gigaspora rosea]|uniref:Uncharacterized protein n=1 Tax=Gigaspora rosea TaxID=44941 RepID=A0A397USQ3_9GLOM|nr:hypothetical protein C2G38_74387 [Gigaspora rosea]